MIIITSKRDGFRRAGLAHRKGPVEYADGHFTDDQLADLQAEPMLTVQIVAAQPASRPNAKDAIEAVRATATIEDLDQLAAGEDRQTVITAIDRRRAELNTPEA